MQFMRTLYFTNAVLVVFVFLDFGMSSENAGKNGVTGVFPCGNAKISVSKRPTGLFVEMNNFTICFSSDKIAKQVLVCEATDSVAILIYRIDDWGSSFYDKLIVVRHDAIIHDCLSFQDFLRIDGMERSVVEIGSIAQFPTLTVKVATIDTSLLPAASEEKWENWDAKLTKRIE